MLKGYCLIGFSILVSGCMPVVKDFYYISLEGLKEASILRSGVLNLDGMVGNHAIPLNYAINRRNYTLNFQVPHASYLPSIKVSAVGISGKDSPQLNPIRDMNQVAPNGTVCSSIYQSKDDLTQFVFGWSPRCTNSRNGSGMVIRFDVTMISSNIVSHEKIVFQLKKDGRYWYFDGP